MESSNMDEQRHAFLENQLREHKRNLQLLMEKKAIYAKGEEPLFLLKQIEAEKEEIERIKEELENDKHQLERLYREGIRAFVMNKWELAISSFRRVISIDPNYKDAQFRLEEAERQRELEKLPTSFQERLFRRRLNWEQVGAIAGVIGLLIALGAWLIPNAGSYLFGTPTAIAVATTPSPTVTPTPTDTTTLMPAPTDTPTHMPTPTDTPTFTPTMPTPSPVTVYVQFLHFAIRYAFVIPKKSFIVPSGQTLALSSEGAIAIWIESRYTISPTIPGINMVCDWELHSLDDGVRTVYSRDCAQPLPFNVTSHVGQTELNLRIRGEGGDNYIIEETTASLQITVK